MTMGVVIASHVDKIAEGVYQLIKESAPDVSITYAGGTDDGDVGSSYELIEAAINNNEADELYCFYDLGSAKMTLDMVSDMSDKPITIFDAAFIEGAYTASVLIQGGYKKEEIDAQLAPLKIK
ncbi:PTS-dependent dihydroxyacetone kinase phosphotransferase subunit DhaM [Halolactibacillus alkaliphilus]|uniref:phosphoenolpyruvate--glycerone phosphotransferase n=1 Tax=Halolactibacillus alkaliphilus TaxID=442899 RepID=A0A511WZH1_9BACI|nr:dihydroxyacetone kinase phosphoryl donor subunit DhaM [Halolactibacillus alkaliphilus]GEN56097.1 PTS-dependent dihydroxyacetone kinase phosphotransferase subunit DhaM [Halolactibacillus alkaliphilus]GGN67222.1 PTS-dependent dihydroxyacetone kinase phosphotransferase subunit DhaM [Halolactibacillus alkaliphilus]SFO71344.1 dihydroxyacetone kinase DhaM subunit [Halolactibacillus alkaliphilus]